MTTIRALTAAVGALACLFAGGVAHAQGVSKTNILIGQSSPFSGSNKELGEDIREGLQAYFKQVNEAGGVNGRTLELIALDDANDAKRSGENARILIEQRGVLALIGYASATLSLPALDRKSTRLNSSHQIISYAVFCLKKKITYNSTRHSTPLPST